MLATSLHIYWISFFYSFYSVIVYFCLWIYENRIKRKLKEVPAISGGVIAFLLGLGLHKNPLDCVV